MLKKVLISSLIFSAFFTVTACGKSECEKKCDKLIEMFKKNGMKGEALAKAEAECVDVCEKDKK